MGKNSEEKNLTTFYPAWKKALTGEHKGIYLRVVQSWYNYVFYRCVRHAFSEAGKNQPKSRLPYGLMNAYHESFYRSILIDLRSAIGGISDDLFADRGAHSITAVLKSMEKTTITRGELFKANNMDYEYENKRAMDEELVSEFLRKQGSGIIPSTYAEWRVSRDLHLYVDKLTGKNEQTRSESDIIPSVIFRKCEEALSQKTENLLMFTNKHIAHAATLESILAAPGSVPSKIQSDDLEDAFGAIIGTFDMLASDLFCWSDYSFTLDVFYRLEGVEESFGLEKGQADFKKLYRDFSEKLNKLRKWRPTPPA